MSAPVPGSGLASTQPPVAPAQCRHSRNMDMQRARTGFPAESLRAGRSITGRTSVFSLRTLFSSKPGKIYARLWPRRAALSYAEYGLMRLCVTGSIQVPVETWRTRLWEEALVEAADLRYSLHLHSALTVSSKQYAACCPGPFRALLQHAKRQ